MLCKVSYKQNNNYYSKIVNENELRELDRQYRGFLGLFGDGKDYDKIEDLTVESIQKNGTWTKGGNTYGYF